MAKLKLSEPDVSPDRSDPGPRILTLDIETAPLEAYTWGVNDQTIGIEFVKEDWAIISVSWKWLGDDEVHFLHTGGRGVKRVRDDKALLKKLWQLLDEADIAVGQNIKAFDVPKINARMMVHGMSPYSPVRLVDTMLMARSKGAFTSNKLAWLTKKLTKAKKSEHKKFPGFSLWAACLRDDKAAWEEMEAYNKRDVESTEELYLKLRPWVEKNPNLGTYTNDENPACPKCGGKKLKSKGYRYSQTGKFKRFLCLSCGGQCQSKDNRLTKGKRRTLLGD